MAVNFLKKSKTETEKAAEDAKVREVVEATLTEIEKNGDQAVRELSKKFESNFIGSLEEALHFFEEHPPKGEFVVVVEGTKSK